MKKLTLLLVAVSLYMASPVMGEEIVETSSYYSKVCSEYITFKDRDESSNIADASHCMGFVLGATRMFNLVGQINDETDGYLKLYCPPPGAKIDQSIRIWVKHLEDNPQELHKEPIVTYTYSMQKAFPCK